MNSFFKIEMKLKIFLVVLLVVSLSLNLECKLSKKKASQEYDQDEFSEFDNIEDDDSSKRVKKPVVKEAEKAEFSKFNQAGDDGDVSIEQDDFSNFEEELASSTPSAPPAKQRAESSTQQAKQQQPAFNLNNADDLDAEEFEHFIDEEEFEGFEASSTKTPAATSSKQSSGANKQAADSKPSLKIADVPQHLMSNGNWQNYVYEIVMLVVIAIYLANFLYGKSKNYRLVQAWYDSHRELLERNFSLVGDDGTSPDLPRLTESSQSETGPLIKESENSYALWCSGRQQCDGLLIQLKLIKRQDLINGLFMQMVKPQSDQLILSVEYPSPDDIDTFVLCLSNKKISQQMFNDYQDLASFCSEKKALQLSASVSSDPLNSAVSSKYVLLNEIGEVSNAVLDSRVCAFLNKYPEMVEYVLISDQYVGYKVQVNDEQTSPSSPTDSPTANQTQSAGLPKSRCMLVLCLNVPGRGLQTAPEDMEKMQPAFQLAMYLVDKVPRIRLSKEAKAKALKRRKDVAEQFMKITHKQRQEAAMLRKEEKRRAEKEKIMNESDPEKQKRLEEKEIKREKRKNLSKMKQVKIKAM